MTERTPLVLDESADAPRVWRPNTIASYVRAVARASANKTMELDVWGGQFGAFVARSAVWQDEWRTDLVGVGLRPSTAAAVARSLHAAVGEAGFSGAWYVELTPDGLRISRGRE